MAPSIILGYWNLRGLTQPIRNMLEYIGVEYEDKTYDFDMTDPTDKAKMMHEWIADKTKCPLIVGGSGEKALEFPNLPYYIETRADGSKLKFSQSLTILRHVARTHGLTVEGEDNVCRMEQYEQQIMDIRTAIIGYCGANPMVSMRYPNYPEDIKTMIFTQWNKVLGGKQWVMGDKLTYVDFLFWEMLDWHVLLKADMLDGLDNLGSYYQRFKDLPKIKNYFESPRYTDWPLVGPFGKKFGFFRE